MIGHALLALLAQDVPARGVASVNALPLPELSVADVPRWRDHVRPSTDELAFEEIDWLPSLAEGLVRANAEARPLLLWAMNGHPLGCT